MGVDAEMFVKIRGRERWLSEDSVKRLSYLLSSTIGRDNFLIGDSVFGQPRRALGIVEPFDSEKEGYGAELDGKVAWTQDGPPILAEDDEQFVRVNLRARYYAEDYARGPWLVIKATAEFLEERILGCEIWYGGDSSGICAQLFDRERREELHRFFLSNGHRPYYRESGGFVRFSYKEETPNCPLCGEHMYYCGGGRGCAFVACDGCGRKAVLDSGVAFQVPDGMDFSSNYRQFPLMRKAVRMWSDIPGGFRCV